MRITRRCDDNRIYWEKRWQKLAADEPCANRDVYPLKYAQMVVRPGDRILEAGCGLGRVLRYYHSNGYDIHGFDFIEGAVKTLKAADPDLKVRVDDVTRMQYPDNRFDVVLAFGLYHNLPLEAWSLALSETRRVLRRGGRVCASVRADNLANRLNDWLKSGAPSDGVRGEERCFHKINLSEKELRDIFERNGFHVDAVHGVVNMPILYKARLFRRSDHKDFDESKARRDGYLLNPVGNVLQKVFLAIVPHQYCSVYVVIATR